MVNSGRFTGMNSEEGKKEIVKYLKSQNLADFKVNYKLRDWLISRQRYWGAPIPIIYCDSCGEMPVPEDQLPVKLPENVQFTGKGTSPIATAPEFVNTTCPKCGGKARREVDTMDTFVCSSWYYLRYPNPHLQDRAFDTELVNKWLPVDQYVGGAEHAVMHLLYARFFTKVLYDLGLINFDEPFTRLVHQGTITNKGAKMSKSRGNVVNPDIFVQKYGSDTFRMYMMFMGSYEEGGNWSDEGINGVHRFLNRVWMLIFTILEQKPTGDETAEFNKLLWRQHYTVKYCTQSLEQFHFNTAIARIMELVNDLYLYIQNVSPEKQNTKLFEETLPTLIRLIAPFAPHLGEELWEAIGGSYSVFNSPWPSYDEALLKTEVIKYGIQVDGKIRGQIEIDASVPDEIAIETAKETVKKHLEGKEIAKSMVVPRKLIVFATK